MRKGILGPCQEPEAVADRVDQHGRVLEPREVEIAREVFGELFDLDVVAAPEGDAVQLQPQPGSRERRDKTLLVLELLGCPDSEPLLPGQPNRLPLDLALCGRLTDLPPEI
jgi:hypothetical protein